MLHRHITLLALLLGLVFLNGCSDKSSKKSTTTPGVTLAALSDIQVSEYFSPIEITLDATAPEPLYYFAESDNDTLVEVSVDTSGVLRLNSTGTGSGTGSAEVTVIAFTKNDAAFAVFTLNVAAASFSEFDPLDFITVDDENWTETAVRKVLNTFAFGGHAGDAQIEAWSRMPPEVAIRQMLTADARNPYLSPAEANFPEAAYMGSLEALGNFWNGSSAANPMAEPNRAMYNTIGGWSAPSELWYAGVLLHGGNPARARLGLWETNYHMSVNQNAGIYPRPLLTHYDTVMNTLDDNSSYHNVMAQGAKNAAVAYQYGHNYNRIYSGVFYGNEDFGREYHQLFFGILGEYDHDYHELTAIPNTARALTDMRAEWHDTDTPGSDGINGPDAYVDFETEYHIAGALDILNTSISGTTAKEKLEAIAEVAIDHNESAYNLPLLIISHFADDNLTGDKLARVQSSWASMNPKNLLGFLWAYAVSTDFHSESRIKYRTSLERIMLTANRMILTNDEVRKRIHSPSYTLYLEGVMPFRPLHDVFGHQRSLEAADNPEIFKKAYNNSSERIWNLIQYEASDLGWEKDWRHVVPTDEAGEYVVEAVAAWLWDRFISDGGKHYGPLEKAHIIALLNGKDLGLLLDSANPTRVFTEAELESTYAIALNTAAATRMKLDSSNDDERHSANRYIGLAAAFITALPYYFVEEGR